MFGKLSLKDVDIDKTYKYDKFLDFLLLEVLLFGMSGGEEGVRYILGRDLWSCRPQKEA
jgi:hypothetical protein